MTCMKPDYALSEKDNLLLHLLQTELANSAMCRLIGNMTIYAQKRCVSIATVAKRHFSLPSAEIESVLFTFS